MSQMAQERTDDDAGATAASPPLAFARDVVAASRRRERNQTEGSDGGDAVVGDMAIGE